MSDMVLASSNCFSRAEILRRSAVFAWRISAEAVISREDGVGLVLVEDGEGLGVGGGWWHLANRPFLVGGDGVGDMKESTGEEDRGVFC